MRLFFALLIWLVSFSVLAEVPSIPDVRSNILQMLRDSKTSAQPDGAPSPASDQPGSVRPTKSNVREMVEKRLSDEKNGERGQKDAVTEETSEQALLRERLERALPHTIETRRDWYEGRVEQFYRPKEKTGEGSVEVPHKTLTIRSLKDLEQLESELKGARPAEAE